MTIDRVGLARDLLGSIGQSLGGRSRGNALRNGAVAFGRAEFSREIVLAAHPLSGYPGIEKKGPKANLDGKLGAQRNRRVEAALADVAPRADHVGNHVDRQAHARLPREPSGSGDEPRLPDPWRQLSDRPRPE